MSTRISDLIPDPEDLLALDIEELAGVLLMHLNGRQDRFGLHCYNFFTELRNQPVYPSHRDQVNSALMEAWDWLANEGFLAKQGDDHSRAGVFVTRRGQRLSTREDFAADCKANLLPNRRQFGLLASAALLAPSIAMAQANSGPAAVNFPPNAWHQRVKRIMQLNFTERDAENFDVKEWIDYLVAVKTDCTFISVHSSGAFYPTNLPDYPMSRWLKGRDIFGECARAAKAAGIPAIGRFSPDTAKIELAERHPDWFRRNAKGDIVMASLGGTVPNDPTTSFDYGRTCQFSDYYSDFIPKLIDEVMTRFPIEGVYTNGWPGSGVQACYCVNCKKIGDPRSEAYRVAYENRVLELWDLYNKAVTLKNEGAIFSGNLGGGLRGGEIDMNKLAPLAVWMFADNQGRGEEFGPSWDASQMTRLARVLIPNRPAVNSTGAWANQAPLRWRTMSANTAEVRTRMWQTLAQGGTIHLHWLGFDQGFHEDRRWQQPGLEVLPFQAKHDRHFRNIRTIADVGMVVSPRSNRVYPVPPGCEVLDAFQGMYKILNEQRIPFDFVLDSDLSYENVGRYPVLILSNLAAMDDKQAAEIREYVSRGGSVLATFETGLYDATGKPRADFALADLFAMRRKAPRVGFGTNAGRRSPGMPSIQRIERPHPIVQSFKNTNWIQGSSWRVPISTQDAPILTHIPQHPVYPVEAVFPPNSHTDEQTLVAREVGKSRLVYIAEDIEAGYWRASTGDLGDLVVDALLWLTRDQRPLRIDGPGLLETTAFQTEVGYAVHLVNHTNPNFRGGSFREAFVMGPQKVTLTATSTKRVKSAQLLRAEVAVPFMQTGATLEVTVPSVGEYEVVAFEV